MASHSQKSHPILQ